MKNEKQDYDEIYYNKTFNRHMYRKNVIFVDMIYFYLNNLNLRIIKLNAINLIILINYKLN